MIGAGLALAIPLAAQAQPDDRGDRHPHYMHAMSDVSVAYLLVKHRGGDPPARREEERAMVAIQYAFSTLQNAAAVVRRDPDYQPPADHADYDHRGRLHRALDLLRDAREHVDVEEDDRDARPLKARALEQIDAAIHATEEAIRVMDD
jgi:hypothetical protein